MYASGGKTAIPVSSNYVSNGDVAANDYDKSDFTWDSSWYELDISSKVPAGVKLVHLEVTHRPSVVGNWMYFRKNGYSNSYNMAKFNPTVMGVDHNHDVFIEVDSDRIFEYKGGSSPTTFNVVVKGWLI